MLAAIAEEHQAESRKPSAASPAGALAPPGNAAGAGAGAAGVDVAGAGAEAGAAGSSPPRAKSAPRAALAKMTPLVVDAAGDRPDSLETSVRNSASGKDLVGGEGGGAAGAAGTRVERRRSLDTVRVVGEMGWRWGDVLLLSRVHSRHGESGGGWRLGGLLSLRLQS